jgi:uncharacterized protein (TIGR00255 family)
MSKPQFSLRSMTAFGEGEAICQSGRFIVEIQTVNRRFLEIQPHLPRLLASYEHLIRERLSSELARGQVHLHIHYHRDGPPRVEVKPNTELANQLKEGWLQLSQELELPRHLPIEILAREKDLFTVEEKIEEDDSLEKALMEALDSALSQLVEERKREGHSLAEDLLTRKEALCEFLEEVESLSRDQVALQREKLTQRLNELFSNQKENEERLLREVAILAEKLDVTEEIVRLKIHLTQFEEIVTTTSSKPGEGVGKRLEFLVQELNREVNTIGSKSQNAQIAAAVVSMKSELEKIREQVHNVE